MKWRYESLWEKAKLYMLRAFSEDRTGPLFPFWAILGFELLARAAVARVHPALLADPQSGENLLYACGIGQPKLPRSIPVKAVLLRCTSIVPNFLESDFTRAMALMELRNEELHTGDPAFEEFPSHLWLPEFFRLSELLLGSLERTLEDLIGEKEASAARKIIEATQEETVARAKEKVGRASADFGRLSAEDQEAKRNQASIRLKADRKFMTNVIECPSCGAAGLRRGETIREAEAQLVENEIYQDDYVLPTAFHCFCCDLDLEGNGELSVAGLGDQYVVTWTYDPIEYLEIDVRQYLEMDEYGND